MVGDIKVALNGRILKVGLVGLGRDPVDDVIVAAGVAHAGAKVQQVGDAR